MGLPAATAGKLPTSSCRGVMKILRQSTKLSSSQRWLDDRQSLQALNTPEIDLQRGSVTREAVDGLAKADSQA